MVAVYEASNVQLLATRRQVPTQPPPFLPPPRRRTSSHRQSQAAVRPSSSLQDPVAGASTGHGRRGRDVSMAGSDAVGAGHGRSGADGGRIGPLATGSRGSTLVAPHSGPAEEVMVSAEEIVAPAEETMACSRGGGAGWPGSASEEDEVVRRPWRCGQPGRSRRHSWWRR